MLACRVVEHLDVVEHILPGLDAGLVGSTPYPLAFEQIEEALRDSIVMAVSPPAVSIIDATASDPYDWRFYRVKEWATEASSSRKCCASFRMQRCAI